VEIKAEEPKRSVSYEAVDFPHTAALQVKGKSKHAYA